MAIKTLIGIPCLLNGGTEMQTLSLVHALVSKGNICIILCYFEFSESIVNQFIEAGSQVKLLKWNRRIHPISFLIKLRKEIRSISPHIMHIQYFSPGFLPILASKLSGLKKVIATVHQPYTKNHGEVAKLLLKLSTKLCSKFIVVSQNAEKSWFSSSNLLNEFKALSQQPKHFTIHNAVEQSKIEDICILSEKLAVRKKLCISNDTIVIGCVSRLSFEKGIDILIDAFVKLKKQKNNIFLLIIGSGSEEKHLKKKIVNAKMNENVKFMGYLNWEIAIQYMGTMDVVVVPSRFEGFGLTAAEAMSMGKIVIASDSFGLKELINHKENGLLFQPENVEDLYRKLLFYYENECLIHDIRKKAKDTIKNKYDYPIYCRKINYLYSQLVN